MDDLVLETVADVVETELLHCSPEIHPPKGPRNIYPLRAPDKPLNPDWNYVFQLKLVISLVVCWRLFSRRSRKPQNIISFGRFGSIRKG